MNNRQCKATLEDTHAFAPIQVSPVCHIRLTCLPNTCCYLCLVSPLHLRSHFILPCRTRDLHRLYVPTKAHWDSPLLKRQPIVPTRAPIYCEMPCYSISDTCLTGAPLPSWHALEGHLWPGYLEIVEAPTEFHSTSRISRGCLVCAVVFSSCGPA
jgi:hypothetical protein